MRDYFYSDNERAFEKQEARAYKQRAKDALTKRMIKQTSGFGKTFKRWRANREKLEAYRMGVWKPETKTEVDWGKISYTAILQVINIAILTGCIISGGWFVPILTVPVLIALNIFLLTKDREGNE
jgi:hypothetical protein